MKDVRKGTDGFRQAKTDNSYDGSRHKQTAPEGFKAPQMPVGGGKVQKEAHGYHCHTSKSGVLRNSGHPRASRIGKK